MILELKGIYKDYIQGKMTVPVLKDVNFSMEEGEYLSLIHIYTAFMWGFLSARVSVFTVLSAPIL